MTVGRGRHRCCGCRAWWILLTVLLLHSTTAAALRPPPLSGHPLPKPPPVDSSHVPPTPPLLLPRRQALAAAVTLAASTLGPPPSLAAPPTPPSPPPTLQQRLRDRRFDKPLFNLPPREAAYPDWMEGSWDVSAGFGGYLFPSKTVSKETVVANEYTPGFKQLSIMACADIGPAAATFRQQFYRRSSSGAVVDDRGYNLPAAMRGWLGEGRAPKVISTEYDPVRNPNRCSFSLLPATGGASGNTRVELFTNARESESPGADTFLLSEYLRQVTIFRPGADVIARELVCDYQHFWVYRRTTTAATAAGGRGGFTANLLTAGYLQPQDANYFDSPTEPVVLYSHTYDFRPVASDRARAAAA